MAIQDLSYGNGYGGLFEVYKTGSGRFFRDRKLAEADEAAWLQTDAGKAETQRISDIASLKSQVLNQWKQLGATNIGGGISLEDRAQGLAERLYANQILDLTKLGLGNSAKTQVPVYSPIGMRYIDESGTPQYGQWTTNEYSAVFNPLTAEQAATVRSNPNPEGGGWEYITGYRDPTASEIQNFLTYGDRQIGFLGDIGTAENWQPTGYLQPGNLASWGAQGKGAVSYTVQQAPNGQVYFIPSWGSTSDWGSIAPILSIGAGLLAPGIGSALASTLGTSAAVGSALAGGLIGGTLSEASGGDFLKGAISGGLGAAAAPISGGISEAVGGGMLGSAVGQGVTSAGLAALQGGDVEQALLTGAAMGAANYTPPAQGMNSVLTPAQIESGIGTEGYGVGAQAQASGLFNPTVIGSQATTQTSYPIDMAELAAADAIQLTQQGIGIPAVEQNLVASGLDPLVAADMTQQIALNPELTSTELANNLISTYGSNLYDTTIDQINEAAPKSTEQPVAPTSSDINWGALAKGLLGLLSASQVSQAVPSIQQPVSMGGAYRPADTMPVYSPEYFQQVQQYYNTYLPSTPRDVATPLQQWYSSGYVEPDSVTAKLFSGG